MIQWTAFTRTNHGFRIGTAVIAFVLPLCRKLYVSRQLYSHLGRGVILCVLVWKRHRCWRREVLEYLRDDVPLGMKGFSECQRKDRRAFSAVFQTTTCDHPCN